MSEHQKTTQAVISNQSEIKEHQTVESFALFVPNGDGHVNLTDILAYMELRITALEEALEMLDGP